MRKNPRITKTQKMVEEKVNSDTETSEDSSSDDQKTPENKVTEYEKQRELRIAQNKARIEDLGLRNIANSLMDLSQKGGKRKSNLNSKRVAKNGKGDDEYQPDENPKDDSSDSGLDSSSEEFEEQEKRKKKKLKQKKKVELDSRVVIPDSSLKFMGHCGEKICLTFLKAPEEQVKELMDMYPKGFNGFDCETGAKALRYIAGLKADLLEIEEIICYIREEVTEGLPVSEDFNGEANPCQHQASTQVFRPQHQDSTQVPCPQYQAATPVTGPVQYNVPLYPYHWKFYPYQCPPMTPFGMAPTAWNPYNANYAPPYMGNYSGMP